MKFRAGFVSNSSSSSFIIICKGAPKEKLLEHALPKDHVFSGLVDSAIRSLTGGLEEITDFDNYEDNYGSYLASAEELKEFQSNGFKIFRGSVCNDDWEDPIGAFFHGTGLPRVKEEDFILRSER